LRRTTRWPFGSWGRSDRITEVFPAPRKPVKTVIGIVAGVSELEGMIKEQERGPQLPEIRVGDRGSKNRSRWAQAGAPRRQG
jgi:hypothetical protein